MKKYAMENLNQFACYNWVCFLLSSIYFYLESFHNIQCVDKNLFGTYKIITTKNQIHKGMVIPQRSFARRLVSSLSQWCFFLHWTNSQENWKTESKKYPFSPKNVWEVRKNPSLLPHNILVFQHFTYDVLLSFLVYFWRSFQKSVSLFISFVVENISHYVYNYTYSIVDVSTF